MNNTIIINQVIILFLIIGIGFYAKKRGYITGEVSKGLSELLLNITSPLLVISAFQFHYSPEMLRNAGLVFLCAVGSHTVGILAGLLLYQPFPVSRRKVLQFVTIYTNSGFMGLPVMLSLYGKTGVFYGSIYIAVFNLFIWTNGMAIFTGSEKKNGLRAHARTTAKRLLLNPGIISVFIGIIIFVCSIQLPGFIAKAIDLVGSTTVPLSMLVVGALLAGVDFKRLFSDPLVYFGTFIRLIIMPLFMLAVLKLCGLTGVMLGICIVQVAMPAAANTAIFAELYGGDSEFASRIIAISTLLSMVTIPLVMMLV